MEKIHFKIYHKILIKFSILKIKSINIQNKDYIIMIMILKEIKKNKII